MTQTEMYTGDILIEFLEDLRYPSEPTHRNQLNVFIHALHIFNERQAERGDLWAQFDEHDSIHHMRSKLARIVAMIQSERYKNNPESAAGLREEVLDLINYSAFLWRHLNGGGWVPNVRRSDI